MLRMAVSRVPTLTFVTGNSKKLEEVIAILGPTSTFSIVSAKVDLPELQGEPDEVAREKAKIAAATLGVPVIVEDTSLCFNALGGLPGERCTVLLHCSVERHPNNAWTVAIDQEYTSSGFLKSWVAMACQNFSRLGLTSLRMLNVSLHCVTAQGKKFISLLVAHLAQLSSREYFLARLTYLVGIPSFNPTGIVKPTPRWTRK